MSGLRQLPSGWRENGDGTASPLPRTARQHNMAAGVGEVILSEGCTAGEKDRTASRSMTDDAANPKPNTALDSSTPPQNTDEQKLNKTERRFLQILRARHGRENVGIQNITLKIADDCRYSPDFSVTRLGRITFWEVKGGFMREDGFIKLKVAARAFPEFLFVLAQYKDKAWTEKEVAP